MLITRAAASRASLLALIVVTALVATACRAKPTPAAAAPTATIAATAAPGAAVAAVLTPQPTPGLQYRLSEGSEQAAAAAVLPPAPAQPLSATETQKLLARLPALEGEAGDVKELNLPTDTLPAPRPGTTIKETFPPAPPTTSAPEVAAGPLEVLRYGPEGDVSVAPNLSVTFNQPMVALTGLSDLAKADVPVRLSPQPEGQWRWVGTKTLLFEPAAKTGFAAGRFPAATKYTVEIPAGTTSATGAKLAQGVTFTFTTPAPAIERAFPKTGPTRRDTPLFVSFNQRIDPAAVLKTISVTAGGRTFAVKLIAQDEARADEVLSSLVQNAQEGRWLAFRTTEQLPADTTVTVTIGPGTPSAEGPRSPTHPTSARRARRSSPPPASQPAVWARGARTRSARVARRRRSPASHANSSLRVAPARPARYRSTATTARWPRRARSPAPPTRQRRRR